MASKKHRKKCKAKHLKRENEEKMIKRILKRKKQMNWNDFHYRAMAQDPSLTQMQKDLLGYR